MEMVGVDGEDVERVRNVDGDVDGVFVVGE